MNTAQGRFKIFYYSAGRNLPLHQITQSLKIKFSASGYTLQQSLSQLCPFSNRNKCQKNNLEPLKLTQFNKTDW